MIGVVNVVSTTPVRNIEFMKTLQQEIGIPFGIPFNAFLLEIGSFMIRTQTELVLKSRIVIPRKLQENGFKFEYDSLEKSFQNLLKK